jgi:dTMP kinase
LSAEGFKTSLRGVLNPLVGWLVALDVSPGAITILGLVLSAAAGLARAAGAFTAGGVVLLAGSLCDVLDGMVARASKRAGAFGAVADSSVDRYAESFVLGGLLYYYGVGRGSSWVGPAISTYVVFAALVGSYMVSYVRGRAEGVGIECKVGLMERPERLVVLVVGTLLGPSVMTVLLWPLALLANATAVHRLLHVWKQVKEGASSSSPAGTGAGVAPAGGAPGGARSGLFVTLEGVEGSGKTTQAARLASALGESGHKVLATREPGGTEIGERIRSLLLESRDGSVGPETELLLYMASRAQHVRDVIYPALRSGLVVICDRFSDATVAYQSGARGISEDAVGALGAVATGGLSPDLTVLLDLPEDEGMARLGARGGDPDRMEREDRSFHKSVRDAYLDIARREPGRVKVVNAALSEDEVAARILGLVRDALSARESG